MSDKTWAKTFAIVYFVLGVLLALTGFDVAGVLLAFAAGLLTTEGWAK